MCIRVGVAQLPEVVLGQVCAFESVFESGATRLEVKFLLQVTLMYHVYLCTGTAVRVHVHYSTCT